MKKLNLWLLLSLFAATFSLSACGGSDDDSGDTPAPPSGSIVGTWEAFVKQSNPDDMALRYSHQLTYVFSQDGTFRIKTIYGYGETSAEFQGEETVDFSGRYQAVNGTLTLSNVTYVVTRWDRSKDRGSIEGNKSMQYKLDGNTLTLGTEDQELARFSYHHILVATLTRTSGTLEPIDEAVAVTEASLKGTWDGVIERDFAQGYYQHRRFSFDGKNYVSWHTHQTAGSVNDSEQGLKTVGDKEQGTWEYVDGRLVLTPTKQWASYYITAQSLNDPQYYVFLNYNPETMECDEWYETPESIIQSGIERDLQSNTDWYIHKYEVSDLTKSQLLLRINMDVFTLVKQ